MRPAFVTGGSSGIGLALSQLLAAQGRDVALFARDANRLVAARDAIQDTSPTVSVETYAVDVANRDALNDALSAAVDALGVPDRAIASAGLATPGHFLQQPLSVHDLHMAINYTGALNFVHALAPMMKQAGGGQIGLIASGAAFFGIYGYSAYAPTKFALRGLAEVLRVELAPHNIGVTLCYPPDTDTPQLAEEMRTKPAATQVITGGGGLMSPEAVATRMISGMDANRFEVTPGLQMWALNRLTSVISPLLRRWQSSVVRKVGDK